MDETQQTLAKEREKEVQRTARALTQLHSQIERLTAIVTASENRLQEDASLRTRGVISELDYQKALVGYGEKRVYLADLQDQAWLYRLIAQYR